MVFTLTWDEAKRQATLAHRGIDFADAGLVFAGPVFEFEDVRQDYGERRMNTFGLLSQRMTVVVWTPRGEGRRIISMRYANERELAKYAHRMG